MADEPLTLTSDIDNFLQATNNNAARALLGIPIYKRLNSRTQPFDNLEVSTTGQNYIFAGLPTDRTVLAHIILHPGLAQGGNNIIIAVSSPSETIKPVPSGEFGNGSSFSGDTGAFLDASLTYANTGILNLFVPAVNGLVWMRRSGNYQNASLMTHCFVVGYFDNVIVEHV